MLSTRLWFQVFWRQFSNLEIAQPKPKVAGETREWPRSCQPGATQEVLSPVDMNPRAQGSSVLEEEKKDIIRGRLNL